MDSSGNRGRPTRGRRRQDPRQDEPAPDEQPGRGAWSGFATLRDAVTFLIGAGVLIKAVWFSHGVNLELVLAAAGLLGLPAATAADERRRNR